MSQRADLVLRPSVPVARYLYWEACDGDQSREMLDRNMQRDGIGNDGSPAAATGATSRRPG